MGKLFIDKIDEKDMSKFIKNLDAKKIFYEKNREVFTNINKEKLIGIIIDGTANIEKYDYNGNKTILEKLEKNSIFGDLFYNSTNDISVITTSDSNILLIDYDSLIKNIKNTSSINNIINLLSSKIIELNNRIEILSKRSIKDKLLTFFLTMSQNNHNKTFCIPFSYTELADYLSVDRSSMMREIKKLKDNNYIKTSGRKINLMKY